MLDYVWFVVTLLSALGCGLIAGVFFAFSTFVMKALARLPAEQGIASMQAINVAAVTPPFMAALFGTAFACVVLAIVAVARWHWPGAACLLAGSALYLAGTIVVTIACNVPRNEALSAVAPASAEGAALWPRYVTSWTAWNHVRTVAALLASALLLAAVYPPSQFP